MDSAPISVETKHVWRILAALLILASIALHVRYLVHDCPLDLAPDEAHYWHWSRDLDASYYSKGPLVAWLIRGSCELFGDNAIAVRLPAVACGSLLLVSLYILTAQALGRERLAALVVGAALTIPALSVSSTLMTIDAPFTCCWGWALVLGHRAIIDRSRWAWLPLGLVVGLGILAKYTMALWLPSAVLFLLISREHRLMLRRTGFWLACAGAGLCCLPILWWNIRHDWVSLRHVGGQAGLVQTVNTSFLHWTGPLQYIAGQFGLLLGFWFVVWAIALIAYRPSREAVPSRRYLWCMSAPMFFVFGSFSLRTDVLLNWPVAAYLSGLVLAAPWLMRQITEGKRWKRALLLGSTIGASLLGVATTYLVHDPDTARPVLAAIAGAPTDSNPQPLRRIDPTCRMRGWRFLAANVDRIRIRLKTDDSAPIVAASRWTLASELAFYLEGRPPVYSFGSALWDRQSQFDLWRPNPVRDAQQFRGRTFVFVDVGQLPPEVEAAFDDVEQRQTIRYEESGQLIAFWDVTVCRGFRGFAKAPNRQY